MTRALLIASACGCATIPTGTEPTPAPAAAELEPFDVATFYERQTLPQWVTLGAREMCLWDGQPTLLGIGRSTYDDETPPSRETIEERARENIRWLVDLGGTEGELMALKDGPVTIELVGYQAPLPSDPLDPDRLWLPEETFGEEGPSTGGWALAKLQLPATIEREITDPCPQEELEVRAVAWNRVAAVTPRGHVSPVPDHVKADLEACEAALRQERIDEAYQRCGRVLEREPEVSRAHELLGAIQLMDGDTKRAMLSLAHAIAFGAPSTSTWMAFADAAQSGAQGCDIVEHAMQFDADLTLVARHGVCRYVLGERDRAMAEFKRCLELDATQCDCQLSLYMMASPSRSAEENFAHALDLQRLCPDDQDTPMYVCGAALAAGNCDAARPACPQVDVLGSPLPSRFEEQCPGP